MGIERHLRPLRVHQATSRLLEVGILKAEPPWYRIVAKYPPSTSLVRERARNPDGPPFTHGRSKKKSQQFFQPKEIKYPEDEIRTRFYRDHPWELARPRIIVENDGKDSQHYDWSSIVQARKQLDGERYVLCFRPYIHIHPSISFILIFPSAGDINIFFIRQMKE